MLQANHQRKPICYSPYGHRPVASGLLSLLGFNGERPDPVTGHYLLGNGYRAFNPVLLRFNSPDSWSPFGKGGVNSYAYCLGDPINRADPNGHVGGLNTSSNLRIPVAYKNGPGLVFGEKRTSHTVRSNGTWIEVTLGMDVDGRDKQLSAAYNAAGYVQVFSNGQPNRYYKNNANLITAAGYSAEPVVGIESASNKNFYMQKEVGVEQVSRLKNQKNEISIEQISMLNFQEELTFSLLKDNPSMHVRTAFMQTRDITRHAALAGKIRGVDPSKAGELIKAGIF
jgi:RHS repeat-associated protein